MFDRPDGQQPDERHADHGERVVGRRDGDHRSPAAAEPTDPADRDGTPESEGAVDRPGFADGDQGAGGVDALDGVGAMDSVSAMESVGAVGDGVTDRAVGDGDPGGAADGLPDYSVCDAEQVGVALEQVVGLQAACTLQYLRLVADLDRRGVWKADGQATMANWLALRFKLARSTARVHTRVAAKIDDLPAIAEAFGVGQISFDQLDALCQLADADTEEAWLREAQICDPEGLRRFVRRRRVRDESAKKIRDRRGISFRADPQPGVTQIHGRLEASDAEAVRVELDRLADRLAHPDPDTGTYPTVAQQRADALVALCGLGLAADGDLDRSTVVIHGDIGLLTGEDDAGHAALADQMPVAAAAFQRLACDGRIEWAVDGPDGTTLGVGRAQRHWPAWLARQIRRRDANSCRFPACPNPIHQIHHIAGWSAHLGATDDTNGIGLCWDHHHDVHEGGWTITGNPNATTTFTSPTNQPYLSPCPGVTQHTLDLLDTPPHTHGHDTHGHTHRGPPDPDGDDPDSERPDSDSD